MNQDILVVTATLGNRDSLQKTISAVKEVGGLRVKHILTAPMSKVNQLKEKYPGMEVLPEPENCRGIYPALNNAIKKYAKNFKYVTFINDDDYWLPDFKKLFEIVDAKDDVDVAYGRTLFMSENHEPIGEQTSSPRYKSFKALLKQHIPLFTQQATLIKTELFFKVGGFDESYKLIADTKFWAEAIDTGARFYYKNGLFAAYIIQEGQLSSDGSTQKNEHIRLLNEDMFKHVKGSPTIEKLLFRLYNIDVYIKRIFKYKTVKKMSKQFHKT